MTGLDYMLVAVDDGWEIWTPDGCGACLGMGKTKADALRDTIHNLQKLANDLWADLKARGS
jgi:hypothetical protein